MHGPSLRVPILTAVAGDAAPRITRELTEVYRIVTDESITVSSRVRVHSSRNNIRRKRYNTV